MAHRQGLTLRKSKIRDVRALDYGRWWIVEDGYVLRGEPDRWNLDDVEKFLMQPEETTEEVEDYDRVTRHTLGTGMWKD